jgi:hypothetical protein
MDTHDTLYSLVAAAVGPHATISVTILTEGGGKNVRTTVCKWRATGPDVVGEVVGQGHNPTTAVIGIGRKWAQARRAHAAEVLLRECGNLSDRTLDDETREQWREMLHAAPSVTEYEKRAASYRSTAKRMGDYSRQAA